MKITLNKPHPRRYTTREVEALMEEVGFPAATAAAFQAAGLTGGDVLELDEQDMTQDLGLSRLQVGGESRAVGLGHRASD